MLVDEARRLELDEAPCHTTISHLPTPYLRPCFSRIAWHSRIIFVFSTVIVACFWITFAAWFFAKSSTSFVCSAFIRSIRPFACAWIFTACSSSAFSFFSRHVRWIIIAHFRRACHQRDEPPHRPKVPHLLPREHARAAAWIVAAAGAPLTSAA